MTRTGEVVKEVQDGATGVTVLDNETYESVTVNISEYAGEVSVDDSVVYEEDGSLSGMANYRLIEVK